ncbi:MAG: hypothetical protein WBA53_15045 [Burkholderiaceae bacterium]
MGRYGDRTAPAQVLRYFALAWVAAVALAGCATGLPGAGDPAVDASLKQFSVAPDKAGLYVYRIADSPFTTPPSVIQVDGTTVGLTSLMRYVYVELPPGRHSVQTSGNAMVPLEFESAPGSLTYVLEEVPTVRAQNLGTQLRRVDEAAGQAAVLRTALSGEPYVIKAFAAGPILQTLQVLVEANGKPVAEPGDCEAVNDVGRWPFKAPGTLTVQVSTLPLQIDCRPRDGLFADRLAIAPHPATSRNENVVKSAKAGAVVGGAIGVGLAAATFPVSGGALGALIVAGSALRGAEIGGLAGVALPQQSLAYPDPIVLKFTSATPPSQ